MAKILEKLVLKPLEISGYERVVEVIDEEVGLHGIIAIHNTTLGPALGGIRAYPYSTFDEALNDALRLAKGMTDKATIAQTGTGGGKSVIITDHKSPKSEALLLAFGKAVDAFEGQYICAEDFGMSITDLEIIRKKTRFAVGLASPKSSGDPSHFTAWGVFRGQQAACKFLLGKDSLKGVKVAIQGLGSVGMKLAYHLFWAGASIIVTDVDQKRTQYAARHFGAEVVDSKEFFSVPCDILAPCALGGGINAETIPLLRCRCVAGAANNQLLAEEHGELLKQHGILYVPDFVLNSGGLLNVCVELHSQGYSPTVARESVDNIYHILLNIFQMAAQKDVSPQTVVKDIIEHNLAHQIGKRKTQIVYHH